MSNNKYKILIVEDDGSIRTFVTALLESNGFQVVTAGTASAGLLSFCSHRPDLVVLDLGLPSISGMRIIRTIREESPVPIIVLSARITEQDKVEALDQGANDYVTKPFGPAELLARIRAALRSIIWNSSGDTSKSLVLKDLEIRFDQRQVLVGGQEVRLTQTEYNIVVLLAQHAGKVLTYAAIIREIWGVSDPGSIKKLQVNMANIRKKLGARPGAENYIANELGVGYRMTDG